jgi:signal transduction histidine kinase
LPSSGEAAPADVLARLQAVLDAALVHLSLDRLLDELLTRVRDALEADTCAVLLLDDKGEELVARAAKGIEEEVERGVRIPVGKGFAGRIAATRQPVVIEDVDHSYVLNPILREKGIHSLLGAPLLLENRVLGVIHVGSLVPRVFTPEDISLLQVVAHRVALAIDRALAHQRVIQLTELQREFIALAAHELRTPATTVFGLAATLHERRGVLPPETVAELEDTLYEQADRMRRLVDQLLDLSRLDADYVEITPQKIPLRKCIEEIVDAVAANARDQVEVAVPEHLHVVVDPTALERVVANLVGNALRYGAPPVVVTAEQSDSHVRVYVEDHGEGIAPDFVPYLFERFRRSDQATTKAAGTGLGLSIARTHARAHGGDVFYTPESAGARFELVIPAQPVKA